MANKGKKSRKHGRTKRNGQNSKYINEQRHEKSHIRRMTAHLLRVRLTDTYALNCLHMLNIKVGKPMAMASLRESLRSRLVTQN